MSLKFSRFHHFAIALFLLGCSTVFSQNEEATKPTDAKPVEATNAEPAKPEEPGVQPTPLDPRTIEPQGDMNYSLLGEFVGEVAIGPDKKESLALQVRPIGNDNFEALQYFGGLPGERSHQPERFKLVGHRSGNYLILSGGRWAIIAKPDHCVLVDDEGNRVGRLEKVNRVSPTLGAEPPAGATILFDGKNTDQLINAQVTSDGLLMPGTDVRPMFYDFDLHAEFRLPYMPEMDDQQRGNSGLYLQSRYECQILDSFAQEPKFNGCGSLYRFRSPDVNMCFPPLHWQTYDISLTAARWAADGTKIRNTTITSWLNGVKVQDNVELPNKTGAGKPEEPLLLPIKIQDHKDPVRFQNIWIIDRGLAPGISFPVYPKKK